jgi:hypothetical protein
MADLASAEAVAAALAGELSARADAERERRETHETARAALTDLQLRDGRLGSELDAIERDRVRLADERATADADLANHRRAVVAPVPARDLDLEAAVGAAERELADALSELASLRSESNGAWRGGRRHPTRGGRSSGGGGDRTSPIHRGERQAATERVRGRDQRHAPRRGSHTLRSARRALEFAVAAERSAQTAAETARTSLEAADAQRSSAAERLAGSSTAAAALRGRVEASVVSSTRTRTTSHRARSQEGRWPAAGRGPRRRSGAPAAVEAALFRSCPRLSRRIGLDRGSPGERGRLVVEERLTGGSTGQDAATDDGSTPSPAPVVGRLVDVVRRDATGGVRRLLERTVLAAGSCRLPRAAGADASWLAGGPA